MPQFRIEAQFSANHASKVVLTRPNAWTTERTAGNNTMYSCAGKGTAMYENEMIYQSINDNNIIYLKSEEMFTRYNQLKIFKKWKIPPHAVEAVGECGRDLLRMNKESIIKVIS